MIKALRFLKNVIENSGFSIGETFFPFEANKKTEAILEYIEYELLHYSKIEELFQKLNIPVEIELDKVTDEDRQTIDNLIFLVVIGKEARFKEELPAIFINSIGEYRFILESEQVEGGKQRISFFPTGKTKLRVLISDNEDMKNAQPFTCYCVINSEVFAELTNLDYDDVYKEYTELSDENQYKEEAINNLCMGALKSCDKGGINRDRVLELAEKLLTWKLQKDGENPMVVVNLYQTYKRIRELTKLEREKLLHIASTEDDCYKTAAHLLLENQELAEFYFDKMEESMKELFVTWPIYHFWNKGA